MGFSVNSNGTVNFSQSGWDKFWHGEDSESQRWALEYNNALKQYDQQYQLQQQAQQANLQNLKFNQDMQTKQFNEGLLSQAKQLSSIGINPASQGQTPSTASISNVGGVPSAGSPSSTGRNTTIANKTALAIDLLNALVNLKKSNNEANLIKAQSDSLSRQANVAEYNAETERSKADSSIKLNESSIRVNENSIIYTDALTNNIISDTSRKLMENADFDEYLKSLKTFGLTDSMLSKMQNMDWQVALALGVVQIVGKTPWLTDPEITKEESRRKGLGLPSLTEESANEIIENSNTYFNDLNDTERRGINMFITKYPEFGDNVMSHITQSQISGWKDNNYNSFDIYHALQNLFGVK
uniref:Minor capsid protein n=1 Tax=Dulem virus 233 TaxID=3145710 RepID=A0AAU8AYK8_9VIRU